MSCRRGKTAIPIHVWSADKACCDCSDSRRLRKPRIFAERRHRRRRHRQRANSVKRRPAEFLSFAIEKPIQIEHFWRPRVGGYFEASLLLFAATSTAYAAVATASCHRGQQRCITGATLSKECKDSGNVKPLSKTTICVQGRHISIECSRA